MLSYLFSQFFHLDVLALTMIILVSFIGLVVIMFASRYMQGDSQYNRFLWLMALLIITVIIMVTADNLFLMLFAWSSSNILLVLLMVHKYQWRAALNAGLLAAKTFAVGLATLVCALIILYLQTKETSIQEILKHFNPNDPLNIAALILILITVMTQSAIWPYHRWLLSSLNSPTPVSAIMHAGLVNGGGFLLARFAPMYLAVPHILSILFILGIITACLGTLWKLVQHDVKRMLACSTMGQMGFMLVQCGLGLFSAAIAHLCWHGMFKANLFLSSNSVVKENRFHIEQTLTLSKFSLAVVCGLIASYFFSLAIHAEWPVKDTRLILMVISFITASQFSLTLLCIVNLKWQRLLMIIIGTLLSAYLYGLTVYMMELIFRSMHFFQPQPLNITYLLGILLLLLAWVMILFKEKIFNNEKLTYLSRIFYMKLLNASQPHPSTITSYRNHYRYE